MPDKNGFDGIGAEIDAERAKEMTPQERQYHDIARKLLQKERDLRAPGSARSAEERVDQLLEIIAKEQF